MLIALAKQKGGIMYKDLRSFLEELRKSKEVLEIKDELSTHHEIAGVMKYLDKLQGSCLLFNRVKGYDIPIVGNLLGRKKRLAIAMGVEEESLAEEYSKRREKPIKPKIVPTGPVKDVVIKDINILKTIPVLTHFERDKSPYLTSAVTIAKDPETGMRGMGIHRVQIRGDKEVGIALATPPLSTFLKKADEKGEPLEIAIAIGMDPITFFSSVIWAPEGIDKFDIAGGLATAPIELVKCESVELEVPAGAEIVLEGYLTPNKRVPEGPLGESSGYYFTFESPVGEIKVITHRKKPIYNALMPFTIEESILMDLSWELDNLKSIQATFPNVLKVHLKMLGFIAIVQIDKKSENDPSRIIEHMIDFHPFVKIVIVVDKDVDVYDPYEIDWAIATRFQPDKDMMVKSDLPGFMLDPSAEGGEMAFETPILITKTSKLGIDATKPLDQPERFEKIDVPPKVRERVMEVIKGLKI